MLLSGLGTDAGTGAAHHAEMNPDSGTLVLRCEWCGEEVRLEEAGAMLPEPEGFVDRHRDCLNRAAAAAHVDLTNGPRAPARHSG